jgi:hypothetical protein
MSERPQAAGDWRKYPTQKITAPSATMGTGFESLTATTANPKAHSHHATA